MLIQCEGIRLSIHAASYPRRMKEALVLVSFFTFFVNFLMESAMCIDVQSQ